MWKAVRTRTVRIMKKKSLKLDNQLVMNHANELLAHDLYHRMSNCQCPCLSGYPRLQQKFHE
jgi:hypothetical protein